MVCPAGHRAYQGRTLLGRKTRSSAEAGHREGRAGLTGRGRGIIAEAGGLRSASPDRRAMPTPVDPSLTAEACNQAGNQVALPLPVTSPRAACERVRAHRVRLALRMCAGSWQARFCGGGPGAFVLRASLPRRAADPRASPTGSARRRGRPATPSAPGACRIGTGRTRKSGAAGAVIVGHAEERLRGCTSS